MSIINVSNLTFSYGEGDYIFKDASFVLDSDWRLGFVGRNGRGKTTFLRLLMGQMEYTGSITSNVSFDYFPFEVEDKSQLVVDIAGEIVPDLQLWRIQKELNLLGVGEDRLYMPFNTLSGGEQSKVLLAALFVKENNFLLIDEPTNHLDSEARAAVSKYLSAKKSFILVSHDRAFLDGAVDHILSINRASIDLIKGNFSTWLEAKERQDSFEKSQNDKLRGEIDRLKTAAKRNSDWAAKGHRESTESPDSRQIGFKEFHRKKAGKLDSQAKQMEKRFDKFAEEKSKLLKNVESTWELKLSPLKHHSRRLALLRDLDIFYGERQICGGLNLEIEQGDRIALSGKNGCGKTSLIKLLLGAGENISSDKTNASPSQTGFFGDTSYPTANPTANPTAIAKRDMTNTKINTAQENQSGDKQYAVPPSFSGELWVAPNLKISYVSQDTSFLRGSLRDFADLNKLDETLFKAILSKLDFPSAQLGKDISVFSAGQKKKVLLAKSLSEKAHLYIWDEPLNFVDILSRLQLENLLKEYAPTMLFVEHDSAFSRSAATKTLVM